MITDLSAGQDRIDLSSLDLVFVGEASFTGSGPELRWSAQDGVLRLEADLDGNRLADVVILLEGMQAISEKDFLL